ncbi:MAG: ribonuclease Z [Bacteroidota bacterium]
MKFELKILGSNAAIPSHGRKPSAQIFNKDDRLYLIDCGEGTQTQIDTLGVKKSKIRQIFISHMHGDHIFGLPGLLTSYALLGRDRPLELFAPSGMKEWMEACLTYSYSHLPYELKINIVDPNIYQLIYEDQHVEVFTIPLNHRVPACGYLFREKKQLPKILASQIERYNIPIPEIRKIKKEGADFTDEAGNVIPNSELTLPPPLPRSFAYCTDTAYSTDIVPLIKDVDLLFHEATYMESEVEQTIFSKHSTSIQAANIAKAANVKQLIIGHFSSRYKNLQPLLEEAQSVFPNTRLALEGAIFKVERRQAAIEV